MKKPICLFISLVIVSVTIAQNSFPPTGSVGIGSATPTMALHVSAARAGDVNEGQGHLLLEGLDAYNSSQSGNSSGVGAGAQILFRGKYSSGGNLTGLALISGSKENTTDGNYGGTLRFYTRTNGSNNPNEWMRITSIGKVGIGTMAPVLALHVSAFKSGDSNEGQGQLLLEGLDEYNSAQNAAASGAGAGAQILFRGKYNSGGSLTGLALISGSKENTTDGNYGGTLRFYTRTNTTNDQNERMRITSEGKIGIGTISPTEKLSVEGNISANGLVTAKKIRVTQLGWSDYVFYKGYKLRSLFSLETFIKQNKRLPEVPSAKEVEEKGISVGDTQALLLKKIEELTLYVINLKKENDTLKKNQRIINTKLKKNKIY